MIERIEAIEALLSALRHIVPINAATALCYGDSAAERFFSTHPDRFADVGRKRFEHAPTMRRVRMSDGPILTEGKVALRQGFGDWEVIMDTQSDAILNIPVRTVSGKAVGQLNLMGRSGDFTPNIQIAIQTLVNLAADCFVAPAEQEPFS